MQLQFSFMCFLVRDYFQISFGSIFKTQETGPTSLIKTNAEGFPGGAVVENLPANAGDTGSSPGLGGSHMPRSN